MNYLDSKQLSLDYSKFLKDSSWYPDANTGNMHEFAYLFLGVGGESGEAQDAFKKLYRNGSEGFLWSRDGTKLLKIIDEIGDIQWYLTRILDQMGVTQEEVLIHNVLKLYNRLQNNDEVPEEFNNPVWPLSVISYQAAIDLDLVLCRKLGGPL